MAGSSAIAILVEVGQAGDAILLILNVVLARNLTMLFLDILNILSIFLVELLLRARIRNPILAVGALLVVGLIFNDRLLEGYLRSC